MVCFLNDETSNDVIEGMISANDIQAYILFDHVATNYFISSMFSHRNNLNVSSL